MTLPDRPTEFGSLESEPLSGRSLVGSAEGLPQQAPREVHPVHRHLEMPRSFSLEAGIFRDVVPGGVDYVRFCERHQWAGVRVTERQHVGPCQMCEDEIDARIGQQRFRELIGLWDRA